MHTQPCASMACETITPGGQDHLADKLHGPCLRALPPVFLLDPVAISLVLTGLLLQTGVALHCWALLRLALPQCKLVQPLGAADADFHLLPSTLPGAAIEHTPVCCR